MTSTFDIRSDDTKAKRESFGNLRYQILRNGQPVARYWHDYRGDEHGIEFSDGGNELWPVGRMVDFLEGGGPSPLRLSERAIAYLGERLGG